MNLLILKALCEKKEGGIKRLAVEIGMSEQNLHRCIKLNKMQAEDLEKAAHILKVPITIFFEQDDNSSPYSIVNGDGSAASVYGDASASDIADKDKEIQHLKELLSEKERTIQILMNNNK